MKSLSPKPRNQLWLSEVDSASLISENIKSKGRHVRESNSLSLEGANFKYRNYSVKLSAVVQENAMPWRTFQLYQRKQNYVYNFYVHVCSYMYSSTGLEDANANSFWVLCGFLIVLKRFDLLFFWMIKQAYLTKKDVQVQVKQFFSFEQ